MTFLQLARSESYVPSKPPATRSADEIIVFALGHPIRVDALRIFSEREASVKEIARELRQESKKVENHVKALLDHGCIQWTRCEKKRGAKEHFYRASLEMVTSAEDWERLPPEERLASSANIFLLAAADVLAALRTAKFDIRLDRHLSYQAEEVDEQGWAEMAALFEETAQRAAQIMRDADPRVEQAGFGIPIVTTLICAERAPSAKGSAISRLALPSSRKD